MIHGNGTPPNPNGILAKAGTATAAADLRVGIITAYGELAGAGAVPSSIVAFAHPTVLATEWARIATGSGVPMHDDSPNGMLTIGPGVPVIGVPQLGESPASVLVADVASCFLVQRDGFMIESDQGLGVGFANDAQQLRCKVRVNVNCPTPAKSLRQFTITGTTGTSRQQVDRSGGRLLVSGPGRRCRPRVVARLNLPVRPHVGGRLLGRAQGLRDRSRRSAWTVPNLPPTRPGRWRAYSGPVRASSGPLGSPSVSHSRSNSTPSSSSVRSSMPWGRRAASRRQRGPHHFLGRPVRAGGGSSSPHSTGCVHRSSLTRLRLARLNCKYLALTKA